MNKRLAIKFYGVLGYMLIVLLLGIALLEKFPTNSIIGVGFFIAELIGFALLFKFLLSKEFSKYLDQHAEYVKKEENQITMNQMVRFDTALVIIGLMIAFVKKIGLNILYDLGYMNLALRLNDIIIFAIIIYFLFVLMGICFTYEVFKENKKSSK